MINKIKPKSDFGRNVLTLMTGTAIAQAIPIAISPILTRIYSPSEFGLFALFLSVVTIPALIVTGRYELAIMLPKKDDDAMNIVLSSITISFFVSVIVFFVVFIFNENITDLLENEEISNWLYFIPFTVFMTGLYKSLDYWFNRKKEYKDISSNKILQSGVTGGSNLIFGFGGLTNIGLIFGNLFGQFLTTSYFARIFYKKYKMEIKLNKIKSYALLKKYKKFPIYNMPNAVIDGLRLSGISILIAKFYTTAVLGQFSLAWRMVQMPASIIGSSITQVFYQNISTIDNSKLFNYVNRFIFKMALIAFIPFLLLYLYGKIIFMFIFGESWGMAGEIVEILVPWLYLNFISSPISMVVIKINKQEFSLLASIVYMVIPLTILIIFNELSILSIINYISFGMSSVLFIYITIVYGILWKIR